MRNINFKCALLSLCFVAGNLCAQEKPEDKDFYSTIASFGQAGNANRPMEEIPEMILPQKKNLQWANNRKHRFEPIQKITNQTAIADGLKALRKQYAPFLQDIAPRFTSTRKEIRIEAMQFRYETTEDQQSFSGLEQGNGPWKTINMPYYHGPQGPSTAWYRTEIEIPADLLDQPSVMIHFNGSDYYTDAYINGHHVGYHEGMLDEFEFDIKKYARSGKNTILVKVRNDYSMLGGEGKPRFWGNKLSASNCPGWDDPMSGWSCCPTGYGIYQDVYIVGKSAPYITDIFCRPLLDEKAVELWTEIDMEDGTLANEFQLKYSLFGQNFKATIAKDQTKTIRVEGGRVLNRTLIPIPEKVLRLWTPDAPWLYQMQIALYDKTGAKLLDNRKQQFGMRQFIISKNSTPKGRMYLNGEEIRLRGTNTMGFLQQQAMAHNWEGLTDDLLLAKLTNMNFIRTTQRIVQKEVYELADRVGIMMQADMPLFAYINQKQFPEILKQASGIERVLRNHPSVILMTYVNEPMAEVKAHAISRYAYERMFDALDVVVHNENPERAVKYIDGDYQAPSNGYPDNHCYNIWYDGHGVSLEKMCRGAWMPISKGWMYGCGEFGAEGLDPVDLMTRRYPKEWMKTETDGSWSPKYMRGIYAGEQTYEKHWNWFETESTPKAWVEASHAHQAWGVSKVARAFRRMPRMNSFAIHLFIDAWPNGWMKAIMDCERTAKPAWFAYRDALTPLAVQIETERTAFSSGETHPFQLWICNDTHTLPKGEIRYTLELNGRIINTGKSEAEIPTLTKGSQFQGLLPVTMPKVNKRSTLTLRVGLFDQSTGEALHEETAVCTLYPKTKTQSPKRVYLIGESKDANALTNIYPKTDIVQSGVIKANDLILISKTTLEAKDISAIQAAVSNGATAIVLPSALQADVWKQWNLETFKPNNSWVLFRNRTHAWNKGTKARDLTYSYSSTLQTPERYHFTPFEANDFTPILTHTQKMVLAEKSVNAGRWIICGLDLNGKLDMNPSLQNILKSIYK